MSSSCLRDKVSNKLIHLLAKYGLDDNTAINIEKGIYNNTIQYCNSKNIDLLTFSGFSEKNELNGLGKVNVWINSNYFNFVEMAHHLFLVALVDSISLGREFVEKSRSKAIR